MSFARIAFPLSLAMVTACGARSSRPPVSPSPSLPTSLPTETGVASWYGPGFNGRPTASGEIYDQAAMTAAHKTIPLGSRIRVTNLENDRVIEVRVNDRGPFVGTRVLDLSHAAADKLGFVRQGTARVRIEVLYSPRPIDSIRSQVALTLQLGSFTSRENADRLRMRVEKNFRDVTVVTARASGTTVYRVQLGEFTSRNAAEVEAGRVRRAGFDAFVVEK